MPGQSETKGKEGGIIMAFLWWGKDWVCGCGCECGRSTVYFGKRVEMGSMRREAERWRLSGENREVERWDTGDERRETGSLKSLPREHDMAYHGIYDSGEVNGKTTGDRVQYQNGRTIG